MEERSSFIHSHPWILFSSINSEIFCLRASNENLSTPYPSAISNLISFIAPFDSLGNEIASPKSQLRKKDERITTLDVMVNQIVESHNTQIRGYGDLEDKLKDVIAKLRKRVPHLDILDYLGVKDSEEMRSYPI